ncbi:hypothetical protein ACFRI7_20665 [Streptomyces sp. NPDC056716]|uniref:hypothetical protein n=1 Tax=unclassified Streptomyces TaxID=2593676 RepID=UPI0036B7DD2C
MDVRFDVGETLAPGFCHLSTVVGIDHYVMRCFDGRVLEWDSYTLVSDSPPPFDRWWIANTPGLGSYLFTATADVPAAARYRKELSGLVLLDSEGDASLSGAYGALATYSDGPDVLFAEEVSNDTGRLVFVGRPFTT